MFTGSSRNESVAVLTKNYLEMNLFRSFGYLRSLLTFDAPLHPQFSDAHFTSPIGSAKDGWFQSLLTEGRTKTPQYAWEDGWKTSCDGREFLYQSYWSHR